MEGIYQVYYDEHIYIPHIYMMTGSLQKLRRTDTIFDAHVMSLKLSVVVGAIHFLILTGSSVKNLVCISRSRLS